MTRFYTFVIYVNAANHYVDKHHVMPDSLEQIEDEYNHFDGRYQEVPTGPWHLRPSFRPIGKLTGGPYLWMIENPPPGLPDGTRFLIYANPDKQEVKYEIIWEWDLAERVAKDDALRASDGARNPREHTNP